MSISNEHKTQNTFKSCQCNLNFQQRTHRGKGQQTLVFKITATQKGFTYYGKLAWDPDRI